MKSIKSDVESGTIKTSEYSDFLLMKLWGCTPKEFEKQDEYMINLHKNIISIENKFDYLQQKRQTQKAKF